MPALAIAVVLGAASLAHAQIEPADPEVFTQVSHARMRSILQSMGIQFAEKMLDESYAFALQIQGDKITLINQVTDMQLFAALADPVDPAKVDQWNRRSRFGRAYFNTRGGSFLESHLDFAGGVSRQTIEAYIRQFQITLSDCLAFVTAQPGPSFEAPPAPILALNTPSPMDVAPAAAPAPETAAPAAEPPPPAPQPPPQSRAYYKSPSAHKPIKTAIGDFVIWVDETQWTCKPEKTDALRFLHAHGDAGARVITTRPGIPTDRLKDVALANARKIDPNAKIVFEEKRLVNGREVLALQIAATAKGIPFRYFGYYHGGTSGAIQMVAYTVESAFSDSLETFTDFLNGLEILDKDVPPAAIESSPLP